MRSLKKKGGEGGGGGGEGGAGVEITFRNFNRPNSFYKS